MALNKTENSRTAVADVIEWGERHLADRGFVNPRLDVELLAADVLKVKRLDLCLHASGLLKPGEQERIVSDVKRRAAHEPVQYITGNTGFYGLEFETGAGCFIPRPETEKLVEVLLGETRSLKDREIWGLDLCTGSGNIAISILKNMPKAVFHAVDISKEALDLAGKNAAKNRVAGRITFFEGDLFGPVEPGEKYDIIVSNPPYIRSKEFAGLPAEVREFEPKAALIPGDEEGLSFYSRVIAGSGSFLKSGGILAFEVGDEPQAMAVEKLFEKSLLFSRIERFKDYNRIDRVVLGISR
ncbi:peptide chain release factor N(5)-glutamine methyltransferase [Candidatus Auribacterota bacterium]